MVLSPITKQRIAIVLNVSKFVFQWGFIPAILFLGFSKGADPGMPELSLMKTKKKRMTFVPTCITKWRAPFVTLFFFQLIMAVNLSWVLSKRNYGYH